MTTELTVEQNKAAIIEQVVIGGDLSKLTPPQRVSYYHQVCESLGLNPLTKPFAYLNLSGKLVLYAQRDATDQLRRLHGVSIKITERKTMEGVYIVGAAATDKNGRTDESSGAVPIANLKGEALANALMKSETKAKRRVTLSICGLGWMDETEVETVAEARPAYVDPETGEIKDAKPGNGAPKEPEYMAWVRKTKAEIAALTTADAVHDWQTRNQKALDKLLKLSADAHNEMAQTLARRWSALSEPTRDKADEGPLPI